jgi:hypothetical protein
MQNPIVHFEIGCRDLENTQTFFGSMFDWKMQRAENAAMIDTGSPVSGHITCLGHEPHHYTIFYVQVEDVGAYLEKACPSEGNHWCRRSISPTARVRGLQNPKEIRSACLSREAPRAAIEYRDKRPFDVGPEAN